MASVHTEYSLFIPQTPLAVWVSRGLSASNGIIGMWSLGKDSNGGEIIDFHFQQILSVLSICISWHLMLSCIANVCPDKPVIGVYKGHQHSRVEAAVETLKTALF